MSLKITTLVEDSRGENLTLKNIHGLAFYVESEEKRIFFDTGQKDYVIHNANMLGLDLSKIDEIIISHNHYDHGGGLKHLINKYGPQKIIVHEKFFREKYAIKNNTFKYSGSGINEEEIRKRKCKIKKIKNNITFLSDNFFIAANFLRYNDFEKENQHFVIKKDNDYEVDRFEDEIALGIKSTKGLVIILGCSHPGPVNIINHIIKETGITDIYMILGGTHLIGGDERRIINTIEHLKKFNIDYLGLSHCTGKKAEKYLNKEFPDKFFSNHTGYSIII